MRGALSSPDAALAFIKEQGVVLESGRGVVPSLTQAIAGESILGSWWGHPKGRVIFRVTRAVRDSADVLVCRLIDGKITYVHRRSWPALVRLADEIGPARLDAIREEHTKSGAHKLVTIAFPQWVPPEVRNAAEKLSAVEARRQCGHWLTAEKSPKSPASRKVKRSRR
jgi:hypothetical protein